MASPQTKPTRKTPAKKASVKAKPASVDQSQKSENDSQYEGYRVIKKYPNRRLYDTKQSTYITLFDIKDLVMTQEAFVVIDAKSGEEITRSILMQIILEEE
jgi:polyhydroxyalkanoate synthesis regulator protein